MRGKLKAVLHERSNYFLMIPVLLGSSLQRQIVPSRSPVPTMCTLAGLALVLLQDGAGSELTHFKLETPLSCVVGGALPDPVIC